MPHNILLYYKPLAMSVRTKQVDDYIAKAQDFAKPILVHLRDIIHAACPEVEEKIKWGCPHFGYKGPFCHMAAFKQHCAFGFWKAALMTAGKDFKANQEHAMGSLGQIKSLKDLPADKMLKTWLKEAMQLNDANIKVAKAKPTEKKDVVVPDYFTKALSKNKAAQKVFKDFSPSCKREYVEWINGSQDRRNPR